ncbi:hypothetical protein [Rhodalgimonas zhirmunskyi]|uniref:Uncharacterized protein n=1 Tax=Rhodalgimonas zhirmunskyi TaxID=2964767 RepID=A0AAJ1X5M8_9RHOB|nr:hypothetical protein [Rhodoalgimonas zhirmunskyi]MDQ2093759.1 hypothetical protein [Rhodoalgimonas zhirmunskyi]
MKKRAFAGILLLICATMARADYVEPARGSADRKALMDALRPHAEWVLGKPVEFVISELRLAQGQGLPGPVAFAMVRAQRPGGGKIDLTTTPGVKRGDYDPGYMDGSSFQALYRKVSDTWVAVHWEVGATDAWWYDPALCEEYFAVIPEACAG